MLASNNTDARSTSGEEIKNENVTPKGRPALVNPMNNGIEEQEQNGVMVPRSVPNMFPHIPVNLPNIFFGSFWWEIALYIRNCKN